MRLIVDVMDDCTIMLNMKGNNCGINSNWENFNILANFSCSAHEEGQWNK